MGDRSLVDATPAERHRVVAARFSELVDAVDGWDAPSPVPEWDARGIVDHLATWVPGFLAAGGIELPPPPPAATDPAAAWRVLRDGVQALLDDPTTGDATFVHPMAGTHPLAEALDRFYTADLFMHSWDLAKAAGVEPDLDAGWAEDLLAGMEPMEDVLRQSGHYGPRHPVAAGTDVVSRLMAFVGRDPAWQRPSD